MPTAKRERKKERHQARQQAIRAAQRRARQRRQAIVVLVIVAALVVGVFGISALQGGGKKTKTTKTTGTTRATPTTASGEGPEQPRPVAAGAKLTGPTPCPKPDGSSTRATTFAKPPSTCIDPARSYSAVFQTTAGIIEVALDTRGTPGTVNNFVVLSRYHFYDGSAIHRTDPSIDIIQGGSPTTQSASDPGPGYTIKDEGAPPRHYVPGDLVMARSSGPDSAAAQFFFVAGPKASALDSQGTYVTFGKVTKGLDVVQKILASHVPYPSSSPQASLGGAPRRAVIVTRIEIRES